MLYSAQCAGLAVQAVVYLTGVVCPVSGQIQVVGLIALIERYKFGARSKATDPTLGLLGGDSAVSVIATPKFVVNNVSARACSLAKRLDPPWFWFMAPLHYVSDCSLVLSFLLRTGLCLRWPRHQTGLLRGTGSIVLYQLPPVHTAWA